MIPHSEWVWMPHPGHFICSRDCKFHLTTRVGDYLVSTLGEYWPDSQIRKITAECRGIEIVGKGDAWNADYMRKIGYEEIGCGRRYETMVFRAVPSNHECCPWEQESGSDIDFDGYNDAGEAYRGHIAMCEKYASLSPAEKSQTVTDAKTSVAHAESSVQNNPGENNDHTR